MIPKKPREGSTYLKKGIRQISIITDRPGALHKRWTKPCPKNPDGSAVSETRAREIARELQAAYDAGPWDPWAPEAKPELESVERYGERWCDDRAQRRDLRAVRDDRSRLRNWVFPMIGHLPIADVQRDELERVRDMLDESVRAEEIRWKTAENIWFVVTKLFRDAANSKVRALRVRDDNPCAGIEPPDRGRERAKSYLYPSESSALGECAAIEREFRELVTVTTYLYLRHGEIAALGCEDIDLEHGDVHVHRAMDGKTHEIRETKTEAGNRHVPIEPTVKPLLAAIMRRRGGRGLLFPRVPAQRDASKMLRAALWEAGVRREALYANDATRKPLTFHDLRATGITWMAVRGDDAVKIQRRAGHEDSETTLGYIREAENRRAGFGTVFPAIPAGLCPLAATPPATPTPTQHAIERETQRGERVPAAGVELSRGSTPGSTPRHSEAVSPEGSHGESVGGHPATVAATARSTGSPEETARRFATWARGALLEPDTFAVDGESAPC